MFSILFCFQNILFFAFEIEKTLKQNQIHVTRKVTWTANKKMAEDFTEMDLNVEINGNLLPVIHKNLATLEQKKKNKKEIESVLQKKYISL